MEGSMRHAARLRKVGGSVMLAIPPALLDALHLKPDASVGMTVNSGKLFVEAKARARYTLDELLSQCGSEAAVDAEEREWMDAPAVGRELI
jgi:antitoxin ChpS